VRCNGRESDYHRGRETIGQPCIRGLRITVWDVLGWLAAGMSENEILSDYPELESADFRAVFEYAARVGRRVASAEKRTNLSGTVGMRNSDIRRRLHSTRKA
jgi:uncharacterized protein (DUF433 family)